MRTLARSAMVVAAFAALMVNPAAGSHARASRLPAPVTLQGVAGVTYNTPLAQAKARWGSFPIAISSDGSSLSGYAAICAGRMRGRAFFRGPDGGQPGRVFLNSVTFVRGARTDKNVGIGSTANDLKAAYGSRLVRDPRLDPGNGYLVLGASVVSHNVPVAIAFGLDDSSKRVRQVIRLSYGLKGEVGGYDDLVDVQC